MNVRWVVQNILNLLKEPDFSDPLEEKIAEEYKIDNKKFFKAAAEYTTKYEKKE